MKQRRIYNRLLAVVAPMLCAGFVACQKESLCDMQGAQGAQEFTITVTDGGYAAAATEGAQPATRIAEEGYRTRFTAGDRCGLYIVRNNKLIYSNIKLTATAGADGTLTWQPEAGVTLKGGLEGELYFLYYPYQDDMTGSVNVWGTEDIDFFSYLRAGWQPKADQSNYADYTASDLMTATGVATKSASGTMTLSFSMTHRTALAIIELPSKVYKFTNTTGGAIPDYTIVGEADFTDSDAKPYCIAPGTYRYIIGITNGYTPTISGSFDGGKKSFSFKPETISVGHYKRYRVGGGGTTTVQHNLQVGDFLMKDGSLLPKGTVLSAAQKANVAAIVFWSPAETDYTDTSRITPARLTDDKIMVADYPECNHGLAVCVKQITDNGAETMVWQQEHDYQYMWQQLSFNPVHHDKSDFVNIDPYIKDKTSNINRIYGYQHTILHEAYNEYCKTQNLNSRIVRPIVAIAEFAKTNPAPVGSTGWFMPSTKELHTLCDKDIDDIWSAPHSTDTRDMVNASLAAADGDALVNQMYWATFESASNSVLSVHFDNAGVGNSTKDRQLRVRAVCAF